MKDIVRGFIMGLSFVSALLFFILISFKNSMEVTKIVLSSFPNWDLSLGLIFAILNVIFYGFFVKNLKEETNGKRRKR